MQLSENTLHSNVFMYNCQDRALVELPLYLDHFLAAALLLVPVKDELSGDTCITLNLFTGICLSSKNL